MGWADLIEVALHVVPKWLATTFLVGLLVYATITHDAGPILWWVQESARSMPAAPASAHGHRHTQLSQPRLPSALGVG